MTGNVGDTPPFKVIGIRQRAKKIYISHAQTYAVAYEPKPKKLISDEDSKKVVMKINSNLEKTTLGDIDTLAALKDKLEQGE